MLKINSVTKPLFAIFVAVFLIYDISTKNIFAKNSEPISKKLWQEISAEELENLKKLYAALENRNFSEASNYAAKIKEIEQKQNKKMLFSDAVGDLILWKKFSGKLDSKRTSFSDISRFTADNPFYPNLEEMKRNVEQVAIANDIPFQVAEPYFKAIPAESKESKIYLTQSKIEYLSSAKLSENDRDEARRDVQKSIAEIWIDENFSKQEEESFLAKYEGQLTSDNHFSRAENLLWRGKNEEAKRIFHLLDDD